MKRSVILKKVSKVALSLVLSTSLLSFGSSAFAKSDDISSGSNNKDGWKEYIVTYKTDDKDWKKKRPSHKDKGDIENLLEDQGAKLISASSDLHYVVIKLPSEKAAEKLRHKKNITAVDENKPLKAEPMAEDWLSYNVNRPQESSWGRDAVLSAMKSKGLDFKGDKVKVMVIDDGIETDHPDVKYEYYSDNGIGATGTHGTEVQGIINAPDNGIGAVGISPNVRMFHWQYSTGRGSGGSEITSSSRVADGLSFAVANGIEVVNMSFSLASGVKFPDSIYQVFQEANAKGIFLVASAGNDGKSNCAKNGSCSYPAGYPEVISVSALEDTNKLADYSNRGSGYIDFTAPTGLITTVHHIFYAPYYYRGAFNGTSASAPVVTAVLALYKQAYPQLKNQDLLNIVKQEAKNVGLPSSEQGAGMIQAPQSWSGYTVDDLTHGIALYTSISGSTYVSGNTIKLYSRVMDDPTKAPVVSGHPPRPYERPFEGVNIRHTIYDPSGNQTYTTVITAGTNGRYDADLKVDRAKFPVKGKYTITTRTSYTDPVTGQYLYTLKNNYVTIN